MGVAVFWPERVTEFTLRDGAGSAVQGKTIVAGEVVRTQERRDGGGEEIQLHVGNKDVYGFNFHWLQSADILALRAQPTDPDDIERLEYGDAFVRPLALLTGRRRLPLPASGPVVPLPPRRRRASPARSHPRPH